MKGPAVQPHPVCLLLAGAMCALPFLIPYHQLPILSFYPEWLAAGLGVCASLIVLAWRGTAVVSVPLPAVLLLGFALLVLARVADPGQDYPQISLVAALYVLFAALTMWLGTQLASALGAERVALVLAAFLLAGALANALAGVIQFYGRPALLEDAVASLNGSRAYGNIAQANLYASYLALGQCALLLLWLRLRVRTAYAVPALLLLAAGSALSGSRGALAFALWVALLGYLAARIEPGTEARRLRSAALAVAVAVLAAHFTVPWVNAVLHLGPSGEGAFDRLQASWGQSPEIRWQIYSIAARMFAAAPILGVGMGGFAGAAFELGLDPALTRIGEIWTSPHDLPLQLLAETGAAGAVVALGGLGVWGWRAVQRYLSRPQPALWWFVATSGIGLIHSLFEFPMWSAHFLGVAALLMGAALEAPSRPASRSARIAGAGSCGVLLLALAILLRDYVRLDATRITGTTVTLASPADARRDAATMRELTRGLMAPQAEFWIVMGMRLDQGDLAGKLAMSERVARFWPANAVVVRRAALLALHGEADAARALLGRALQAFPHRRSATIEILEAASADDASAMTSLLALARNAPMP